MSRKGFVNEIVSQFSCSCTYAKPNCGRSYRWLGGVRALEGGTLRVMGGVSKLCAGVCNVERTFALGNCRGKKMCTQSWHC